MSEAMQDAGGDLLIGLSQVQNVGQVTLKADLDDPKVAHALQSAVDLPVPGKLGVASNDAGARVAWMAPDELLILIPGGAEAAQGIVDALQSALQKIHHMALNVTDARGVVSLTGDRVGEVLAKGAACDCSDRGFLIGTARRTHLAGLAVGIWRLDQDAWEVVCFRSYAHHLVAWLEQTAVPGSEVGFR